MRATALIFLKLMLLTDAGMHIQYYPPNTPASSATIDNFVFTVIATHECGVMTGRPNAFRHMT